ncbi:MAG: hypothetical protein ACRDP5_15885 [Streptosporangiaceae bacterium]
MAITLERLRQEMMKPPAWPLHPDAGPYCDCCLHIRRAGDDAPRRVAAAYVWVTQAGNEVPLCVSCCALWRANATEDVDLLPVRIYSIS